MMNIKNNIQQILDTGYEILFELEKEEPDLKAVKNLYDERSTKITKLNEFSEDKNGHYSQTDKKSLKNLFLRVQLLEKKLNGRLAVLSKRKMNDLKELGFHKKAKSLYNQTSVQTEVQERKIVDIKSNF